MGVTLERVQNKFACIIGELCNEPYILSQFAIWVDLRIAEYKAKGSIALDCTGNIPEPTWLKGLNPPIPAQSDPPLHRGHSTAASKNARFKRHGLGSSPTAIPHPTSDTSRLQEHDTSDSEILELVVKSEPQEVFPVSLHVHDRLSADRANSRKRVSTQDQDVMHSDNSIFPTSSSTPPKSRRLSSHSDNSLSAGGQDSVSNQSFLSVIGLGDQPSSSSVSDQASDALLTVQRYEASQISEEDQRLGVDPSISASSQPGFDQFSLSCPETIEPIIADSLPIKQKRRRFEDNTSSNTRSAVHRFSVWLWLNAQDNRPIETIPPEELDPFLSDFYRTVRTQDGAEYTPRSFRSLRERLQRHLKSHNYPVSIVNSPDFANSKDTFNSRIVELSGLCNVSTTDNAKLEVH